MNTFFKILPYILLSPFYGFLIVVMYWAILTQVPPQTARVVDYSPKMLQSGEEITLHYNVTWYRPCVYHVTRSLVNNNNTILIGSVEMVTTPGYDPNFFVKIQIPYSTPDGFYDLKIDVRPICNLFDYYFGKTINIKPMPIHVDNTPAVLNKVVISNPVLKENESLNITSYYYKRRACAASVDTLVTLRDNTIVNKFSRPSINATLGDNVTKELLNPGVPPGKYIFLRSIVYDCAHKVYQLTYPGTSFEVIQ